MNSVPKKAIIAGNWKMYKTIQEATDFLQTLIPNIQPSSNEVLLAVPYTIIQTAVELTKDTPILIGAQNMNDASEGAFTGEVAAKMLLEIGAKFVILGHSERRHIFQESDAFIHKKVLRAFVDNIQPILCIGEKWDERQAGKTDEVLKNQLLADLADLKPENIDQLIIAYEPIWAIGSDKAATPEIVQEVHRHIRDILTESWGQHAAENARILYGGSVKVDNASTLLQQPDIDGLLIGGASLTPETFSKIVNMQINKTE